MVASHEKPTDANANLPQGDETERASGGRTDADKAADAAPKDRAQDENLKQRQEDLLDEAIEETFPASDPIAPKQIT
ncbi:MAG TPA: hypothetical protein VGC82_21355 [Rhodopila sp.]|jgi:hypothetical protein